MKKTFRDRERSVAIHRRIKRSHGLPRCTSSRGAQRRGNRSDKAELRNRAALQNSYESDVLSDGASGAVAVMHRAFDVVDTGAVADAL